MDPLRTDVQIGNPEQPGYLRAVRQVAVDPTTDLSWFPRATLAELGIRPLKEWRFQSPNGAELTRWTGAVRLYVAGTSTIDEVVFGEPSDPVVLGMRSLAGLNLRIDPITGRLVDAGPAHTTLAGI